MDKTTRLTSYLIRARLRNLHPSIRSLTTVGINGDKVEQINTSDESSHDPNGSNTRNISISLLKQRMMNPQQRSTSTTRTGIVVNLFALSQSVLDGKLSVDEFVASHTFQKLQSHMDNSIDSFTDSQIINILSSLLRMRVNVDLHLIRLLEHEVKFRLKKLSLSNIIKLLNFYKSIKLTLEQNQLVELLGFRIQKDLQSNPNITLKDINHIIRLSRSELIPRSWLSLVDERLLSMLIRGDQVDSAIDRILNTDASFEYFTLCRLFIEIAECKRRPTPVMRAAAMVLLSTPMTSEEDSPTDVLMETLNALISLSYPNSMLLKKLIGDLKSSTDLTALDTHKRRGLLEMLTILRWKDDEIMEAFVNDLSNNPDSLNNCPFFASKLVQTCATFNYTSSKFRECYLQHIKPIKEPILEETQHQWLRYVWSLANLDLVEEKQMRDLLSRYISQDKSVATTTCNSSSMKLLNLYFIAKQSFDINDLDSESFNKLGKLKINRNSSLQKMSAKMHDAMNGIIESSDQIRNDIQTPFGFYVDSEFWLNGDFKFIKIDDSKSLKSIETFDINPSHYHNSSDNIYKCAVICTSFEDTIVNQTNQVIGHRQMAAKILKKLGFMPIFLDGNKIANMESGADLYTLLQSQVKSQLGKG